MKNYMSKEFYYHQIEKCEKQIAIFQYQLSVAENEIIIKEITEALELTENLLSHYKKIYWEVAFNEKK